VILYADALAKRDTSAALEIPVIAPDGSRERATLLVGPASQLVSVHEPWDGEELEDADAVAYIQSKVEALGARRALAFDQDDEMFASGASDFE
jgi:hypothetical protein